MRFTELPIKGAFLVQLEPIPDERGFFSRSWCRREFEQYGLNPNLVQCNISFNKKKGTLRGMHHQGKPHQEAKLVRCTMGAICDVILDLRPESSSYRRWCAVELSAQNRDMVYIPEGVAHGFQTLADNTEVFYQMSEFYHPECALGVRWDDPAFGIEWPLANPLMSEKDCSYPLMA